MKIILQNLLDPHCGYSINELEPRLFSFNSPVGACKECDGFRRQSVFLIKIEIINKELSLSEGAIKGWDKRNEFYYQIIKSLSNHYKFNIDSSFSSLNKKVQNIILNGTGEEEIKFNY